MIRSAMSDVPEAEYTRIFGNIKKEEPKITVVDDGGKRIDVLLPRHKNRLYAQARALKEGLRDSLCTRSECWNPVEKNIKKMIHNEMKNPKVQAFKMAMQAIGADPKDCNVESLRRR